MFSSEKTNINWPEYSGKGKYSSYHLPRKIFCNIHKICIYVSQMVDSAA